MQNTIGRTRVAKCPPTERKRKREKEREREREKAKDKEKEREGGARSRPQRHITTPQFALSRQDSATSGEYN